MTRRTLCRLLVPVAALTLAGCGATTGPVAMSGTAPVSETESASVTVAPPRTTEAGSDTEAPSSGATAQAGLEPTCAAEPLALGAGEIEAATGHRYLPLAVRNCSGEAVTLTGPPGLAVLDQEGSTLAVTVSEKEPAGELRLKPDATAYVGLTWLANTRGSDPTAGHELVVTVDGLGSAGVLDTLDLGATGEIGTYSWRDSLDGLFDYQP